MNRIALWRFGDNSVTSPDIFWLTGAGRTQLSRLQNLALLFPAPPGGKTVLARRWNDLSVTLLDFLLDIPPRSGARRKGLSGAALNLGFVERTTHDRGHRSVTPLIPITKLGSSAQTPAPSDELQTARARFTSAEAALEEAEEKSRAARKKRKEAKKIARVAKKSLRMAKEEFAQAERDLAEARRSVARKRAAATRAKSRARKARRIERQIGRKNAPVESQPSTSPLTEGTSDSTPPEPGSV